MEKAFMLIVVKKRTEEAGELQQLLTLNGNIIRTRLGLHPGSNKNDEDLGTIFLELAGTIEEQGILETKLNVIDYVTAKRVTIAY